jgi:hypothetical protein
MDCILYESLKTKTERRGASRGEEEYVTTNDGFPYPPLLLLTSSPLISPSLCLSTTRARTYWMQTNRGGTVPLRLLYPEVEVNAG